MKSPWKFISNLTSRRRADESTSEETPVPVADVPQLPAPTPDPVEEIETTEAPDNAKAEPVAVEPVDGDTANNGQDHVETVTVNQEPSAEDQSFEPVAPEEPISDDEVAVVAAEEPAKSILATQGIDADEAPVSKADAEEDHQELPTALVTNELVLAAVQNTPVVRSARKPAKRQAAIPADQQFLLDMNAVDTDIRQLKQALAKKLREQNSQLQSLIDRY